MGSVPNIELEATSRYCSELRSPSSVGSVPPSDGLCESTSSRSAPPPLKLTSPISGGRLPERSLLRSTSDSMLLSSPSCEGRLPEMALYERSTCVRLRISPTPLHPLRLPLSPLPRSRSDVILPAVQPSPSR